MIHLLIVHSSSDLYGSDKSLLDFVARSDFEITIALPAEGPLIAELEAVGATVFVGEVCKIRREMFSPWGLLKLMIAANNSRRFLGRLHSARKFDLVYSNTLAVFGGALASRSWGVPHVWHVREIMNGSRILALAFRSIVSALSTKVVCNSGETLARICPSVSSAKYCVVWNGFDASGRSFNRQAVRAELGAVGDEVLVVLVGRINRWKGQKLLVEAFSKLDASALRNCRLAIVGSATEGQEHYETKLARYITESGCAARISFHPHRGDIDPVWDAADVVVVPSTEPEPFGRVAIEAMGFGKPVIAAAHGGLLEIVVHGVTGLLVTPSDPGELTNALHLLTCDVNMREKMGQAGRIRQRDLFSVNSYATKLNQLLCSVVDKHQRNILFVHQSAEMYGSDKVLLWLVTGLQARGVCVIVLLPSDGPLCAALKAEGVETHIVEVIKLNRESLSLISLLKFPSAIYASLREVKRSVAGRNIDLVYSNTLAVLGGAVYSVFNRIPHLWHVHELLMSPNLVRSGYPLMLRMLSDKVVCNSTMTARWLLDEQPMLSRKTLTIWNGLGARPPVNIAAAESLRINLQLQTGQLLVALVGRINRWKGQSLLVDAATDLWVRGIKHVHYVVVGGVAEGNEHLIDALQARIAASPASAQIHVVDFTDDIWSVWDACDIAVVPSTEPEPFGMVAIEAMASNKPVVVAAHGGLLDIVEDGVSGLRFKPKDVGMFADQLQMLISEPALRQRLAAQGCERQKQQFSLDAQLVRTLEVIKDMTPEVDAKND